jgi:hypothetical protein
MTADQYRSDVLPEIYKRYSYKDGLLCVGKTKDGVSPLQICVPTADNPSSPWNPTTCYIWNREKWLYTGPLSDAALVSRLSRKFKICQVVYTTVSKMETTQDGVRACICTDADMKACKKRCQFKQDRTAMIPVKVCG